MLQNESNDDDLEHFEDITEEEEDKSSSVEKKTNTVEKAVPTNSAVTSNNDSSGDEADSSASDSEDGDFNVAGSLNEDGFYDLTNTKNEAEESGKPTIPSKDTSLLPGGYNPRNREPSFWYLDLLFFLFSISYNSATGVESDVMGLLFLVRGNCRYGPHKWDQVAKGVMVAHLVLDTTIVAHKSSKSFVNLQILVNIGGRN